jgi:hypothetical protein
MKNLTATLLILQILCISLLANAHSVSVDHHSSEGTHFHLEKIESIAKATTATSPDINNLSDTHDPSNHTHIPLLALSSSSSVSPAVKNVLPSTLHSAYLGQTLSPPVPPPNN